jgi:hypothetical protein
MCGLPIVLPLILIFILLFLVVHSISPSGQIYYSIVLLDMPPLIPLVVAHDDG